MLDIALLLQPGAEKPLYQQLYESISAQIKAGNLRLRDSHFGGYLHLGFSFIES